jgi:hypothetical protein
VTLPPMPIATAAGYAVDINDPSQITDFDAFVGLTHIRGGGMGTDTATGAKTRLAFQADGIQTAGRRVPRSLSKIGVVFLVGCGSSRTAKIRPQQKSPNPRCSIKIFAPGGESCDFRCG